MSQKILKLLVVLALAALFPTLAQAADDQQAIGDRLATFTAAWNHHDVKHMALHWAPHGDLINPFGEVANGRPEVEKLFEREQAGPMKASSFALNVESVKMTGGIALVDADCNITKIQKPDGTPAPDMPCHLFLVMVRDNDNWLIVSARPYVFVHKPGT